MEKRQYYFLLKPIVIRYSNDNTSEFAHLWLKLDSTGGNRNM